MGRRIETALGTSAPQLLCSLRCMERPVGPPSPVRPAAVVIANVLGPPDLHSRYSTAQHSTAGSSVTPTEALHAPITEASVAPSRPAQPAPNRHGCLPCSARLGQRSPHTSKSGRTWERSSSAAAASVCTGASPQLQAEARETAGAAQPCRCIARWVLQMDMLPEAAWEHPLAACQQRHTQHPAPNAPLIEEAALRLQVGKEGSVAGAAEEGQPPNLKVAPAGAEGRRRPRGWRRQGAAGAGQPPRSGPNCEPAEWRMPPRSATWQQEGIAPPSP